MSVRRAPFVAVLALASSAAVADKGPAKTPVFGTEISLAGGSFLQPAMLQRFRYGAPGVNLTADATNPGGLGTFGWDDEGTAATRTPLVREGM